MNLPDRHESLKAVMAQIVQAAHAGRWADVLAGYERRAALLAAHPECLADADALLVVDQEIFERAQAASASLRQQLRRVADQVRWLDHLRRLLTPTATAAHGSRLDRQG